MAEAGTAHAGTLTEEELEAQRTEFEKEQGKESGTAAAAQEAGQETEEEKRQREETARKAAEEAAEGEVKKLSPIAQEHINKKISRLVGETKAEREARFKIELENAELRGRIKAQEEMGKKPIGAADDNPKPKRDDFESDEEYLDARDEWNRKEWRKEQTQTLTEERTRERAQSEAQGVINATVEHGRAAHSDFDEVVSANNLQWSTEMKDASLAAGPVLAAEIGYYFGKNPAEVERIKTLSPAAQMVEVGAVKAMIQQSKKQSTKAPPPVAPPKSGASPTEQSIFTMSDADIAQGLIERQKQKYR